MMSTTYILHLQSLFCFPLYLEARAALDVRQGLEAVATWVFAQRKSYSIRGSVNAPVAHNLPWRPTPPNDPLVIMLMIGSRERLYERLRQRLR